MDWTRKWPMNSEQLGFSQSATIVGIAEATCRYIIPTTWKWFELAMIAAVRLLLALMISRQSAMSQWTVAAERLNYLAQPTVWVQQWHRSLSLSRSTPMIIWFCGFERYKRAEYMLKSLLGILPYQVFCLVVEPPPLKKKQSPTIWLCAYNCDNTGTSTRGLWLILEWGSCSDTAICHVECNDL